MAKKPLIKIKIAEPQVNYQGDFRAYAVKGRRGFNPLYQSRVVGRESYLKKLGLHQDIETFMVSNPGLPLPTKELIERYHVSKGQIKRISISVENAHNLPKRKHGNPHRSKI